MRFFIGIHLLLYIFLPGAIKAQVTIGTDSYPKKGALLDLKEDDGLKENSTKGMLLPRVNLTDSINLYPMFTSGYDKSTKDAEHVGLVVYNANACFDKGSYIYVWDGSRWVSLGGETSNLYSYKDQDGNDFLARRFGEAGIWMVQNLAAKTYDQRRNSDGDAIVRTILEGEIEFPDTKETLVKTYPWMGVFYDFATATNTIPGGATHNSINSRIVQGICPYGWHMPSSAEWADLERELIKNTKEYTTLTTNLADEGVSLDDEPGATNETGRNPYGEKFRRAALSACPVPGGDAEIDGVSLNALGGGFAIRMVGAVDGNGQVDGYGIKAGFWVATRKDTNGMNRVYLNSQNFINNNEGTPSRHYAIRCKKNDNIP